MATFVDLFCGGGFGARGAVSGGGVPLLGLDAWELATRTYKANFSDADVITSYIEQVNVQELGNKYQPDVLLTSPECTSHSIARGSKPGSERSRETALGIVPWVEAMNPRWVIVENVNRMKKWDRHNELVQTIESLGYSVSDLYLNAAEFGAAQARKRMFLVCDREGTTVTSYITPGSTIMTDENPAYNRLSSWFTHRAVEHAVEFSTLDGVNDNQAESYYSRLRRYVLGVSHRIEPKYLADIAIEMAWREDMRRRTEKEKLSNLLHALFSNGLSKWWRGYWQGYHRPGELLWSGSS